MAGKDYYAILGVGRGASEKELRSAYRKLARKYHPDVNPSDKVAEARFKEINEAYQVLSEPEKRKKYDQYGEHWEQAEQFSRAGAEGFGAGAGAPGGYSFRWGGAGPGGRSGTAGGGRTPFGDLGGGFDSIFDIFGGRGGARSRKERGQDIEHPVEITLEEAYHGAARTVQLETEEVCTACGGTGTVKGAPCPTCGGTSVIPRVRRLEVKIPAGVKDGARVRLSGEGGAGTGGAPRGDLYLLVTVRPHERFERRGDDLYVDVNLPLTTALLGGEVAVPTVRGTRVMLKVPPETQNGTAIRLAGLGMPRLDSTTKGDLYARIKVALPTRLTPRQRELVEQLQAELAREGGERR